MDFIVRCCLLSLLLRSAVSSAVVNQSLTTGNNDGMNCQIILDAVAELRTELASIKAAIAVRSNERK